MFNGGGCKKMYTYRLVENIEEKQLIYKLRYDIYCKEKGWLDSSNYVEGLETDKYDESSIHIAAFDIDNILVGSVRMIIPETDMPLPIEECFEIGKDFTQDRFEVSRLVIPKDRRGITISIGLIRTIYDWAIENKMTHAYAIIENNFMIYLNRIGYPFKPIKEGKDHFGGYTIPTCFILSEVADYFVKNRETNIIRI